MASQRTLDPEMLDAERSVERFLVPVVIQVNGERLELQLEPWTTLLDLLRERLFLTGTKKGCDHGQCGACTVLIDGKRANACLALAVIHDGASIVTIEGLAADAAASSHDRDVHPSRRASGHDMAQRTTHLHPVQQAFIDHDAFQCGYCTPGQICSAVGLLREGHIDTRDDIREQMSGNICRCGAYTQIVEAIADVANMDGDRTRLSGDTEPRS